VLGQVFEDDPRTLRRARVGLPPWFANLLPEGELRRQIIHELGGGNIGDFTLLLKLGAYLPGAVTVHGDSQPEADDPAPASSYPEPDHPIWHSQAGVQLKYTVSGDRLTFPAHGNGGWWTVKLPDRSLRELAVNEYLTMRWLALAGFSVPAVQLVPAAAVGGIPDGLVDPAELVYLTERFDRVPGGRVHFEDFAQVADVPPMHKYSQSGATYDSMAAAIRYLVGQPGYEDFVGRLAAMLVTGNVDAHLKNWSLIYRDGRPAEMAPIYDFHSLTVYGRYRYSPLALSLNGQTLATSVGPDDFRRLAERAGADPELTVDCAVEAIHRLRMAWAGGASEESKTRYPDLAEHYRRRLETLPICLMG